MGHQGTAFVGNIGNGAGLFASQTEREIAVFAVQALAAIGGKNEELYLQKIRRNMTAHAAVKKAAKDALVKLSKG